MTDIAKLVLDTDTRGLRTGERALDSISSKAGQISQNIGKSLQGLGTRLSIGVTAPLALFGKQAIQSSIDAQEMESAFDVVFGNMADGVREWSETTGDALGRSTQEIQRGALAFQELFGKALQPEKAADLSKEFAVLTQDLASFKNLSNDVAQQKLFSGLTGEAEPLRAVGVFINDAAVKAKALELGIGGVNGKLTDQEKIVARAALIQEQLSDAQGDVLRTGDSAANQIKATQAAFEELSIIIGTKVLPALTPIITKVGAILTSFSELGDGTQNFILYAGLIAAAVGPILGVFGTLLTLAPALVTAFGLIKGAMALLFANPIILGAAALIGGIYLAWKNWDKIEAIVASVGDAISSWWNDNVSPIFDAVGGKIDEVIGYFDDIFGAGISRVIGFVKQLFAGDFAGAWDSFKSIVKDGLIALGTAFLEIHVKIGDTFLDIANSMIGYGKDIISGLISGIKAAPQAVWNALKSVVGFGVDSVKNFLGINSPSKLFMEFGGFVTEGLAIGIVDGTPNVKRAADNMAAAVGQSVDGIEARLASIGIGQQGSSAELSFDNELTDINKDIAPTFANDVSNPLLQEVDRVSQGFADMARDVESNIKGLVSSFKDGDFLGIITGVADTIGGIFSQGSSGKSIFGSISSLFKSFDGGGFTGGGSRSGGLDGKGGFMAMLHPQETVIDHSRGQQMQGGQTVIINNSALADAYVDNRAANVAAPMAEQASTRGATNALSRIQTNRRKQL